MVIGIDPGLDGAVGCIDSNGEFRSVHDTPTIATKRGSKKYRKYNVAAMVTLLREMSRGKRQLVVALEEVHSMPGQGVRSMFNMGYGLGLWEAIVVSLGIGLQMVQPTTWKRKMVGIGADKEVSRLVAIRRWPAAAEALSRKRDHGRAEALLIAEYVRQTTLS